MIDLQIKTTGLSVLAMDRKDLRKALRAAGNEVARGARAGISRAGLHNRSGRLRRSLKVFLFKSGEGVAIRARAFYAPFHERGAHGPGRRVLPARPFLATAIGERASSIRARLADAITKGVKFAPARKVRSA